MSALRSRLNVVLKLSILAVIAANCEFTHAETNDTNVAQLAFLKASNARPSNHFGTGVAAYGNTVLVGAYGESSKSTGINGNLPNYGCPYAGAAYVFEATNGGWAQRAYLKPATNQEYGQFGISVSLWKDTAVVGSNELISSNGGSAYVFVRSGDSWRQQARLRPRPNARRDEFGWDVAVSEDIIVVGAPEDRSRGRGVNSGSADNSGISVGAAYIFTREGENWKQEAYLKPSSAAGGFKCGSSVAVSGNTAVVGAPKAYGRNNEQSGVAFVFVRTNGTWREQAQLMASDGKTGDYFGGAVSISGDTIAVGAEDGSAVYIFSRTNEQWRETTSIKGRDVRGGGYFGAAVALAGDRLVTGSYSGACLFSRGSNTWQKIAHVTGAESVKYDYFGVAVALSDQVIAVGASAHGVSKLPHAREVDPLDKTGAAFLFRAR